MATARSAHLRLIPSAALGALPGRRFSLLSSTTAYLVRRSLLRLTLSIFRIIAPVAFRKWPLGDSGSWNDRKLSCLSPTMSGEFDNFQRPDRREEVASGLGSEPGSQAIFCQPSPFCPFWGCQNGCPMGKSIPNPRWLSPGNDEAAAHQSSGRFGVFANFFGRGLRAANGRETLQYESRVHITTADRYAQRSPSAHGAAGAVE
jgi:hypothetical protein